MTPRKPIIYGPDGHPIVRARDRHAPKPRKHAGLEGWVSWGLIDRSGHVAKGGEQHNLILNTFLDRIADTALSPLSSFLTHFAVGTGSTPPSVTDAALDNELARTTTTITNTTGRSANGVYVIVIEREFDFGQGNGNLTEFGFAGGAASPMLVRELFRDGGGNPITITKTSDYKLRIKYELEIRLSPTVLTPSSFTITGIGAINGEYAFLGGPDTSTFQTDLNLFSNLARGFVAGSGNYGGVADTVPWLNYLYGTTNTPTGGEASAHSHSTFTPGDWQRSITPVWGTNGANFTIAMVGVLGRRSTSGQTRWRAPGFVFNIDENDRFTKDNLHTLTIDDLLTVSWGRA